MAEVRVNTEEAAPTDPQGGFVQQMPDGSNLQRVTHDPNVEPEKETSTAPEELLAGKYKNVEELVKAYKELESQRGTVKPDAPPTTPVTPPVAPTAPDGKPFDMNEFVTEAATKGALSDESYKTLAEKGIDKATADAFIAGQRAIADAYIGKVHERAGGKDAFNTLTAWATANMTQAEVASIDKALQSGDEGIAGIVLDGLKAKHTAAMGTSPKLVTGGEQDVPAGVKPFGDSDEVVRAMSDKRYTTSPAYRKTVEDRLRVTTALQVNSL